jgi:hypothetical protein
MLRVVATPGVYSYIIVGMQAMQVVSLFHFVFFVEKGPSAVGYELTRGCKVMSYLTQGCKRLTDDLFTSTPSTPTLFDINHQKAIFLISSILHEQNI